MGQMTAMNSMMNETYGDMGVMSEEEQARADARKIGPFSFDVDDDLDTEVLAND